MPVTDAPALPVPERVWLDALASEAAALVAQGVADRAVEHADLVQSGALAYLRALARDTSGGRAITQRHAHGLACARGAMWDLIRFGEAPPAREDGRRSPPPLRTAPRTLRDLPRHQRRRVGRMPAAWQQVVRLTLQGRGPAEIAGIVGVSRAAIDAKKHRAFAVLLRRVS